MEKSGQFKIEVFTPFPEWWRYNVALMCGCFDGGGERVGFASSEDTVAPVGARLREPPAGYPGKRVSVLETPPCRRITLYVYVIPHTLPSGREVGQTKPFELRVKAMRNGQTLLSQSLKVNQWSGISAEFSVEAE